MTSVAVFQVTASVVIALFLLQLLRRLLSRSSNGLAAGVEGGLDFLLAG